MVLSSCINFDILPVTDVVAYVEVRSGHDNRSRGVISELRSLGASIAPTLNKDVRKEIKFSS